MDADQLRLILLAVGATLVVAIYLWDKYKRSRKRLRPMPRSAKRTQPIMVEEDPPEVAETLLSEAVEDDLPRMQAVDDTADAAPLQLSEEDTVFPPSELVTQEELEFSALEHR